MAGFDTVYQDWLSYHKGRRNGERLRRLVEGHGYAEKQLLERVWYPAIGTLNHLHPEYEVIDFRVGNTRLWPALSKSKPLQICG